MNQKDLREFDEKLAAKLYAIRTNGDDTETHHVEADQILINALGVFGMRRTVSEWRLVKKWYA